MPVAIRKRSWEEHVTHASGLQYSYDDLDLVCCHGVDSEGPWMGAGASKQGRRTRCASMPEGSEVRYGPITSSDICFIGQCCSMTVNSIESSETLDIGYSEGNPIQTNITQCADRYVETTTSVSQPMENTDESSVSKELACCKDQTIAQQLENSSSILDTIPEASHVEPDDTPVLDPQKDIASDFTQSPHVQHSNMEDKHVSTEQHTENLPPCPAEREHARLDSMVLLLMKLDQLDQEIENALSATSSMDSTPTLHRRQLMVHTCKLPLFLSVPLWSL
uniref:Uncharacterized protein n=1 Tax=Sander lucioperca TaxID=283035 RepID=A0A8C9YXB3_SANLU